MFSSEDKEKCWREEQGWLARPRDASDWEGFMKIQEKKISFLYLAVIIFLLP